jgi:hypothetical protein
MNPPILVVSKGRGIEDVTKSICYALIFAACPDILIARRVLHQSLCFLFSLFSEAGCSSWPDNILPSQDGSLLFNFKAILLYL